MSLDRGYLSIVDESTLAALLDAQSEQRIEAPYGRVSGWGGEATLRLAAGSRHLIRVLAFGSKLKFARPPYTMPELRTMRLFLRDLGGFVADVRQQRQRYLLQAMTKTKACTAWQVYDAARDVRHPIAARDNHTITLAVPRDADPSLEGVLY